MTAAYRWNFGDIYDAMAEAVDPSAPCLIQGDRVLSWGDFTRRSNNLARALGERGVEVGDKVAFYLRNHPAYMEMLGACFKGRFTHVNVNYRYVDEELHYIFDNSDAKVVLYGQEFASHVEALKPRLPKVAVWLEVANDGSLRVAGAEAYEALAESGDGSRLAIERSGDDLLFIYTGGTTGMPKGVMWGLNDLWLAGAAGATPATDMIPPADLEQHAVNVRRAGGGSRIMPCCPLMHGTGLLTSIACLAGGGSVVLLEQPSFDPVECLEAVERWQVNGLAIVGDAFAKPLLNALDAAPGRYDLTSLVSIISSGVMWSMEVKQGLLKHHGAMVLTDSFGASEAVGFGRSDTTVDGTVETARFVIGEHCKVFTEDGREVKPGDPEPGYIARAGAIPKGYYKDAEKTAKTFPTIGGVRYSMPGDWCRVEADGSLLLLGRGSVCINTAGEKVYPEEVEEVLKQHPDVEDALVVGVPDDKWGQMVTAVVALRTGASLAEDVLKAHARKHLAGYKTPKRILTKASLGRASNGKADYKSITAFAKAELGLP
ncbi:MAG: acyl-CoA synthetase [Gammaproteobacteria bacterium]|nr:acyl-CoA synthetase [Gammaproteobacteria bacterium]